MRGWGHLAALIIVSAIRERSAQRTPVLALLEKSGRNQGQTNSIRCSLDLSPRIGASEPHRVQADRGLVPDHLRAVKDVLGHRQQVAGLQDVARSPHAHPKAAREDAVDLDDAVVVIGEVGAGRVYVPARPVSALLELAPHVLFAERTVALGIPVLDRHTELASAGRRPTVALPRRTSLSQLGLGKGMDSLRIMWEIFPPRPPAPQPRNDATLYVGL